MTPRGQTLRLATRGSDLALRQAGEVRAALESSRRDVELVEVETRGDQIRDELIHRLGKTGAFVRSLDEQVLDGSVDAAVHSMKDMPTEFPPDLVVAGVPARASARDVLVTPDGAPLADLPSGATVGTGSLRRKAQLLAERPDLDVRPLRGNVDTRAEKLLAPSLQRRHEARFDAEEEDEGTYERSPEEWFDDLSELERRALGREVDVEFDAIVLAEAGLHRSGLTGSLEFAQFSPTSFVPAPGQGALAITALEGEGAATIRSHLDHPPTRVTTTVERTVLKHLGGGCIAPIGVYARLRGEQVDVVARVLSTDGTEEVRESRSLPVEDHHTAARRFAEDLRERGAADLVDAAREEADADERDTAAREDGGE
ncbi:hydroxymethylbilane synthase [Halomarina ordinaria]|uniref:Hydroxymethylbilane synthase n=1 Tax=Halomarina ordinaria TaxID=3033939 RepID=A0ABD5UDT9_9EURY|nr:hydroxymethylbilane synthase [Halomarina sp. PSRA2]